MSYNVQQKEVYLRLATHNQSSESGVQQVQCQAMLIHQYPTLKLCLSLPNPSSRFTPPSASGIALFTCLYLVHQQILEEYAVLQPITALYLSRASYAVCLLVVLRTITACQNQLSRFALKPDRSDLLADLSVALVPMYGLGGDHTDAYGESGERIRAMEEDVRKRVCCGVSDSVGGENKEYGWEVALQEDVRGRGGRCRAVRVRAL